MLSLVLMVAGLFIKAFSIWLRLQDSSVKSKKENDNEDDENSEVVIKNSVFGAKKLLHFIFFCYRINIRLQNLMLEV